jgi:uncharacterized protein YdaU (DUF1376 family)
MSNRALPMMPWYPKDFIAATRHLAFAERSLYRELLDYQWELGALPVDNFRLARLIGISVEEFDGLWPAIADKFDRTETGYLNNRLESHRKIALEGKERKQKAAQRTNAKRWQSDTHSDSLSDRSPNRSAIARAAVAQRSPPTPTPTPTSKNPLPPPGGGSADAHDGNGEGANSILSAREAGINPRALGTNPRAVAETEEEQAKWAPLLARAERAGFRKPYPVDSPDSYETALKLHEREKRADLAAARKAIGHGSRS